MGTLPNPKSPKKPVCKFLLLCICLHRVMITVPYLQHLSLSALLVLLCVLGLTLQDNYTSG